ncbi:MAG: bifunctional oligoribonuclease/PAP phosphatase NrnA [Deltaproteobacteria bacterium]|nr:bifunctional oligoribonuclease/PAP phosphatase NrnA [Deltaproteobacteria bacterium]
MIDFSSCIEFIKGDILITAHRHPDGDAMGSVLALREIAIQLGANVVVYSQDPFDESISFLSGFADIVSHVDKNKFFDAVFVLDCGSKKLVGEDLPDSMHRKSLVVIDHHSTRDPFGDIEFVDSKASSCGLLIQELCLQAGLNLNRDISLALWIASSSDTGSFRYSSTDPRTMYYAAQLLENGADPWLCAKALYESNPPERMKLLGLVLSTMQIRHNGKTASLYVSNSMLDESGADMETSSGFVNYVRSIRGVEIAFILRPGDDENLVKVSFRSTGNFPVDKIAALFGGGGHPNAAGASFQCSINCAMDKVFDVIGETYGW